VPGSIGRIGAARPGRLDPGLLIDAQHHRALGRVQVEPNDVAHLVDEKRVLGQLPGLPAVGLQPEGAPHAVHRRLLRPTSRAIERVDQCVASVGVVSSVLTITSSTRSSVTARGRPGRGSSTSPSRRCSANRERHLATIDRSTPSRSAISVFLRPSAANSTILERCANAWALVRRRAHATNRARSASLNSMATATGLGHTPIPPRCHRINASQH
jgi:hypothetical protein